MNSEVLDLTKFPCQKMLLNVIATDRLCARFLTDILLKCYTSSTLIVPYQNHLILHSLLCLIDPVLEAITSIHNLRTNEYTEYTNTLDIAVCHVTYFKSTGIVVEAKVVATDSLNTILKHYIKLMKEPAVYLYVYSDKPSLKQLFCQNVKRFHLTRPHEGNSVLKDVISFNPDCTHLSIQEIKNEMFMKMTIKHLAFATSTNLSHLSLVDCKNIENQLQNLFESTWPNLKHLNLLRTETAEADLKFLCLACNGPEKTLPNLTSLCVTITNKVKECFYTKFLISPWLNLTSLCVDFRLDSDMNIDLCDAIKIKKLQSLTCLEIRTNTLSPEETATVSLCLDQLSKLQILYMHNCIPHDNVEINMNTSLSEIGISSSEDAKWNLSSLTIHSFPLLKTLILSDCGLNSQDLSSLAQAKVRGKLPLLKHLDISENKLSLSDFVCLFDESITWNELVSLDIRNAFNNDAQDDKVIDYMNELVSHGCLSSLKKLGINHFLNRNKCWCLEKLVLLFCKSDTLRNITDGVRCGYFSELQTLCIENFSGHNAGVVRTLSQLGVWCHKTCIPYDNQYNREKCLCEK